MNRIRNTRIVCSFIVLFIFTIQLCVPFGTYIKADASTVMPNPLSEKKLYLPSAKNVITDIEFDDMGLTEGDFLNPSTDIAADSSKTPFTKPVYFSYNGYKVCKDGGNTYISVKSEGSKFINIATPHSFEGIKTIVVSAKIKNPDSAMRVQIGGANALKQHWDTNGCILSYHSDGGIYTLKKKVYDNSASRNDWLDIDVMLSCSYDNVVSVDMLAVNNTTVDVSSIAPCTIPGEQGKYFENLGTLQLSTMGASCTEDISFDDIIVYEPYSYTDVDSFVPEDGSVVSKDTELKVIYVSEPNEYDKSSVKLKKIADGLSSDVVITDIYIDGFAIKLEAELEDSSQYLLYAGTSSASFKTYSGKQSVVGIYPSSGSRIFADETVYIDFEQPVKQEDFSKIRLRKYSGSEYIDTEADFRADSETRIVLNSPLSFNTYYSIMYEEDEYCFSTHPMYMKRPKKIFVYENFDYIDESYVGKMGADIKTASISNSYPVLSYTGYTSSDKKESYTKLVYDAKQGNSKNKSVYLFGNNAKMDVASKADLTGVKNLVVSFDCKTDFSQNKNRHFNLRSASEAYIICQEGASSYSSFRDRTAETGKSTIIPSVDSTKWHRIDAEIAYLKNDGEKPVLQIKYVAVDGNIIDGARAETLFKDSEAIDLSALSTLSLAQYDWAAGGEQGGTYVDNIMVYEPTDVRTEIVSVSHEGYGVVSGGTKFTAQFDMPVSIADKDKISVYENGKNITGDIALSEDKTVLEVSLKSPIDTTSEYSAVIGGLKDIYGDNIPSEEILFTARKYLISKPEISVDSTGVYASAELWGSVPENGAALVIAAYKDDKFIGFDIKEMSANKITTVLCPSEYLADANAFRAFAISNLNDFRLLSGTVLVSRK